MPDRTAHIDATEPARAGGPPPVRPPRAARGPGRLVATTEAVAALDHPTRAAMWALYRAHYERTDEARFFADLDAKDHVILVRDARDPARAVQGFTTLACARHVVEGRPLRVVFSGDTIIAPAYQGQTALQRAFVRYVMGVLWRAREPVYWLLISKGYKTYLLLSRNFLEYWPRADRPTPPWARAALAALARDRFGAAYREDLGVVRFDPPGPRLAGWVAPPPTPDAAEPVHGGGSRPEPAAAPGGSRPGPAGAAEGAEPRPRRSELPEDIRFFLAANPGWVDGDELVCVGRVDLAMGLNYLRRLGGRVARRWRDKLASAGRGPR